MPWWCLQLSEMPWWCLQLSEMPWWCLQLSEMPWWCLQLSEMLWWCLQLSEMPWWCLQTGELHPQSPHTQEAQKKGGSLGGGGEAAPERLQDKGVRGGRHGGGKKRDERRKPKVETTHRGLVATRVWIKMLLHGFGSKKVWVGNHPFWGWSVWSIANVRTIKLLCLISQSTPSNIAAAVFPECVARVPVSLWGLGAEGVFARRCVCGRNRPQPFATVRSRSQPFVWGPYKFCKRCHFWRFPTFRCFVSRGSCGTLSHSDVFCNVSKVVLCGRRNTFATFSEDAWQFSWQA